MAATAPSKRSPTKTRAKTGNSKPRNIAYDPASPRKKASGGKTANKANTSKPRAKKTATGRVTKAKSSPKKKTTTKATKAKTAKVAAAVKKAPAAVSKPVAPAKPVAANKKASAKKVAGKKSPAKKAPAKKKSPVKKVAAKAAKPAVKKVAAPAAAPAKPAEEKKEGIIAKVSNTLNWLLGSPPKVGSHLFFPSGFCVCITPYLFPLQVMLRKVPRQARKSTLLTPSLATGQARTTKACCRSCRCRC